MTVRRRWWSLLAVLLGLSAWATPARAGTTGDGGQVRIEATVGLDGMVAAARAYPVVVDVSSPRLLAATLRVTNDSDVGRDVVQRGIEVAGGTTKRFALTVGSSNGFGGDRVRVDIIEDGATLATISPSITSDVSEELVGVLPGLVDALDRDSVPLVIDAGQARLGAIPAEVLAQGPVALEVYDQIAASGGDLDDLSDADRRSLARWVGQGGYLLLDGGDAADLLPAGFDPSPGTAEVVGFGRVLLTDGALAAGRWEDVLIPTPVQSQAEEDILSSGLFVAGDVTASLASEAGFDLPSIRTLVMVLGVYVLVVGPIAWFAVRRRRTTLLWAIVPAVALATTGALQLAGSEFRQSDEAVHVTMIETGPGGSMGTSTVFVAGQGGATTLDLPPGWLTASNSWFGSFGFFNGEARPRTMSGDGSQVPVEQGVGGAAVFRARGPVDLDGGLVVTATSDTDGLMRGTVDNTLDVDLEEVAIFVARATVVDVGDLAAGASAEWEADDATRFEFDAQPEAEVWPIDVDASSFGFNGEVPFDPRTGEPIDVRASDGGVSSLVSSLSAYSDVVSERGTTFKPQGQAVAVGWTRSLSAPLRIGGSVVSKGRTGIIGRGEVSSVGGRLVDTGTVQFLVRGPSGAGSMDDPDGGGNQPNDGSKVLAVYAFNLPSAVGDRRVDASRLTFHVPALFSRVQVWAGGRWRELPAGDGEVPVPADAVVGQTVFTRVQIGIDRIPGPGRGFVVYEAEP